MPLRLGEYSTRDERVLGISIDRDIVSEVTDRRFLSISRRDTRVELEICRRKESYETHRVR